MEEIKPQSSQNSRGRVRFGIFEVDLEAGELRRQGFKVKLQEQPFQVLVMLLQRPGEIVTREELQKNLWSADTFVDFERGLNRTINKLREALADDSESPRFIETLPRRGYRFLTNVETTRVPEVEAAGGNPQPIVSPGHPVTAEDKVSAGDRISSPAVAWQRVLPWAMAGILAVVAGLASWGGWGAGSRAADRPFLQVDLDTGANEFSHPAISPDGMRIVFVAEGALAIRRLDQTKVIRLAGTEGADYPFFSPNGQWVAFFAARKLQKIALAGGAPVILCDAPNAGGGTWSDDDSIIAALNSVEGLSRVHSAGGSPERLTDAKTEAGGMLHLWPQVIHGGKGVLFAATNGSAQGSLRILTLRGGTFKTVMENSTYGRYLTSGYLIFFRRGSLFAAPMDADRPKSDGPAIPLVNAVSNSGLGPPDFDLSASGTLVYRSNAAEGNLIPYWLYSSGRNEPALAKPGNYSSPRLSPDGTRLALSVVQDGKQNLWVYDLRRETFTRLTFDAGPEVLPTWTPDGEFIAFRSGNSLAWMRADGSGKVERLGGVSPNSGPWSFSADGKWLAFWPLQPHSDLWAARVERGPGELRLGQPQSLTQGAGSKGGPAISPDGRWLAYASDESGRFEIYVAPFSPGGKVGGGRWPVSSGGGTGPIWSQHGRSLFFLSPDRRVRVATYTANGDAFVVERPRLWSEKQLADSTFFTGFDVAPDGGSVLALLGAENPRHETLLHIVLNIDSDLRRRVPPESE